MSYYSDKYHYNLLVGAKPRLLTAGQTFTTTAPQKVYAIEIMEDAVFSALEVDGASVLDDFNFTGNTITTSVAPITPGNIEKRFSTVGLTSGTVMLRLAAK